MTNDEAISRLRALADELGTIADGLLSLADPVVDVPANPQVPDPTPVPEPTPAPPVDTVPAPLPAPAPAPPYDWQDAVESLRTQVFTTDPEITGTRTIRGAAVIDGFNHVAESPAKSVSFAVDVYDGGRLTLRNFDIHGAVPAVDSKGVNCRPATPKSSGVVNLENGRMTKLTSDALKIAGDPTGAVQTIRRVHFGPQAGIVGGGAHYDFITFTGVLSDILIEECLFERIGNPADGLNNWLRIVPNSAGAGAGMTGPGKIMVRRSILYSDKTKSYAIQRGNYAGDVPFLDFEDVALPISVIGLNALFYPGFDYARLRWVNVFDTYTGAPIQAPHASTITT